MVTKIKRIAQFLFDNAELIAEFLCQSNNFRTIEVDLKVHKSLPIELNTMLQLYDDTAGLQDLENDAIFKEKFVRLCAIINEDSGVTGLPKPVEVRDRLESKN